MLRPSAFEYHRPETLDQALALLAEFGDEGRPLAGGQSLVPMMNLRLARPQHLVDINDLGLEAIERDGPILRIGALVRHERYLTDPLIGALMPVFQEGIHYIGHPTIRRHGSIGGSLAHADPTAELPLLAVLYDAQIVVRSMNGERRVAAAAFFHGAYMTAIDPGEMIVAVEFPIPQTAAAGAFIEVGERRGDFALAAVAVQLTIDGGRIGTAAVACSGAAQHAIRLPELERALIGKPLGEPAPENEIARIAGALNPPGDHAASADYRRALLKTLLTRATATACARAREIS